jgi:hypothetical protein
VAAGNPLVGSGSARVMRLGIKFTFLFGATYQDPRMFWWVWFSGRLPPPGGKPAFSFLHPEGNQNLPPTKGYDELALSRLEIA